MISHVSLGVTDLERAALFWRAVLTPLGLSEWQGQDEGGPPMICWFREGHDSPRLYIATPFDDRPATAGNGSMVAFIAPTSHSVDAAYAAGMAQGGTDEGAPGLRTHYAPDYYGAYLRDPDGNKLHLVHRPSLVAEMTVS